MLGAIPNPKKSLVIDFSIEKLKSTIEYVTVLNNTYKLNSKNDILNTYTFEAMEFLSLGIYADISFSKQDEGRTEVTIEIRRKVGAFDQAHEVSKANEHISTLFNLLSHCVVLDEAQITEMEKRKEYVQKNSGCMVAVLVTVGSLLGGSVIYALA
jgi:hypothetical protein